MWLDVSSVITSLTLELEKTQTFFHLVISKESRIIPLQLLPGCKLFLQLSGFQCWGRQLKEANYFLLALEGFEPVPAVVLVLPSLSPCRTAAASQPPLGSLLEFCFPYSHQNL